jgi:DNA-directed RNA polymerase subunit K/omega
MPIKSKLDEEIDDVTNIVEKSIDDPEAGGLDSDQDDDIAGSESDASSTNGSKSQNDNDDDDDDETEDANTDDEDAGDDDEDGPKEKNDDEDEEDVIPKTAKQLRAAKKRATSSKKNMEDDLTLLGVPHGLNFDDDEDDDESEEEHDDEEYFQKLKSDVRQNFAETYHPESFSHNYDEIQTLSKVIRNSFGVIIDDLHRTVPFMTKYEKTRILGQRAKQINEGAPPLIKIDSTVIDGYLIAVKELEQKKTPFIIRRPLPNGGSEYWRVQDLEIL